jgi:hypothetical protein
MDTEKQNLRRAINNNITWNIRDKAIKMPMIMPESYFGMIIDRVTRGITASLYRDHMIREAHRVMYEKHGI